MSKVKKGRKFVKRGKYIRLDEMLGSGSFKKVYHGYDTEKGIDVAWSVIQLSAMSDNELKMVIQEQKIHKMIDHRYIIKWYDSWIDVEPEELITITEMMYSGNLGDYIKRVGAVDITLLKKWCKMILDALNYLHTKNPKIIHRDIKIDNIFLSNGRIKIGDLGLSTQMTGEYKSTMVGTPMYMAPDIMRERYNEKIDIYSFGVTVLELALGKKLRVLNSSHLFDTSLQQGVNPYIEKELQNVEDPALRAFIRRCVEIDPEKRPSAAELFKDPFLAKKRPDESASSDKTKAESSSKGSASSDARHKETLMNNNSLKSSMVLLEEIDSESNSKDGADRSVDLIPTTQGIENTIRSLIEEVESTNPETRYEKKRRAVMLNRIASLFRRQKKLHEAVRYSKKALDLWKFLGDKEELGQAYNQIGMLYKESKSYDLSEKWFLKNLNFHEKELKQRKSPAVGIIYKNLCELYLKKSEYEKALDCSQRAKEILSEYGDEYVNDIKTLQIFTAKIYLRQKQYLKSIDISREMLEKSEEYSLSARELVSIYDKMANSYYRLKEYESAKKYYKLALMDKMVLFQKSSKKISKSYLNLGRVEIRLGNDEEAIKTLKKGFKITKKYPRYNRKVGLEFAIELLKLYYRNEKYLECRPYINHGWKLTRFPTVIPMLKVIEFLDICELILKKMERFEEIRLIQARKSQAFERLEAEARKKAKMNPEDRYTPSPFIRSTDEDNDAPLTRTKSVNYEEKDKSFPAIKSGVDSASVQMKDGAGLGMVRTASLPRGGAGNIAIPSARDTESEKDDGSLAVSLPGGVENERNGISTAASLPKSVEDENFENSKVLSLTWSIDEDVGKKTGSAGKNSKSLKKAKSTAKIRSGPIDDPFSELVGMAKESLRSEKQE